MTRSEPRRRWWLDFVRDNGNPIPARPWHEAYFMRGGIDAIYDNVGAPIGLAAFAPTAPARGRMFSCRHRAGQEGDAPSPVVAEAEIHGAQPVSVDD